MDRSLCTFYQKIGACRHGEKCSRRHVKPTESNTILLANLYQAHKKGEVSGKAEPAAVFDQFYADVFMKAATQGEVESMVVCENENFHLIGNVYVRFTSLAAASKAVMTLNQEWYGGKPVYCDLLPVTSFHEAKCRAHDTNSCDRGGLCNFMHVRRPCNELRKQLLQAQNKSIALARIRKLKGDDWGQEWEEPTKKEYVRENEKKAAHRAEQDDVENKTVKTEELLVKLVKLVDSESKVKAMAKLFA